MTSDPSEQWASASDDDLVSMAQGGDDEAYNQLWQRCVDSSREYASHFVGEGEAEGLVTEAFSEAYQAVVDGHAPRGSFHSYMNATIRAIGMDGTYSNSGYTDDKPVDAEPGGKQGDAIASAFFDLDPDQREALWRTEVEGASAQEIADTMDLRPAQAIYLKIQARTRFNQSISANGGEPITGGDSNRPTTAHPMKQGPSAIGEALLMAVPGFSAGTVGTNGVRGPIDEVGGVARPQGDSVFSHDQGAPDVVAPAAEGEADDVSPWSEEEASSDGDGGDGHRIFAPLPGVAAQPSAREPASLDSLNVDDQEPREADSGPNHVDQAEGFGITGAGAGFDEDAQAPDGVAADIDDNDAGAGVPVAPASLVGMSAGLAASNTPLWEAEGLSSEEDSDDRSQRRKRRLLIIIPLIIVLAIVLFLLTYCLAPSIGQPLPSHEPTSSMTSTPTSETSATVSASASVSPTPSEAPTPSDTPAPTPSMTPTSTPTPSETPTPQDQETTAAPTPSADPQPSATSGPPPAPAPAPAPPPAPAPAPAPPPPKLAVTSVDSGAMNVCSPQLSGTAKPGDMLTVTGLTASPIQVRAGSNGKWTTGRVSMSSSSATVTVTSPSGQKASASVTQAPPPSITASASGGSITVTASGQPGATLDLLVDTTSLGQISMGGGQTSVAFPVPSGVNPGSHVLSGRYVSGSCTGSYALSFFQI